MLTTQIPQLITYIPNISGDREGGGRVSKQLGQPKQ